jgi:Ca2+-binding EF-hand superfamily protein
MRLSNPLCLAIAASAVLCLVAPAALASDTSAEFATIDSNHDGSISSGEHEDYARKMFDLIDTDSDDNISVAELDAAQGKVSDHAGGSDAANSAQKIRRFDTNGDGEVSQTEVATGARLKFQMLDKNSNGALTPQEFAVGW